MDKDKSVFYLRICAFCCIGMLAVLVVCAVLLVPEAQNALRQLGAQVLDVMDDLGRTVPVTPLPAEHTPPLIQPEHLLPDGLPLRPVVKPGLPPRLDQPHQLVEPGG